MLGSGTTNSGEMTRLLILTCDGSVPDRLVETVAERAGQGEVDARVLVPLSPVPDAWTWDEKATRNETLTRLDGAIERLRRTGARVEGTIGCDRDAMVCVNWMMEREPFDEVLVATPRRGSRPPTAPGPRRPDPARVRRSGHACRPARPRQPPPAHGLGCPT